MILAVTCITTLGLTGWRTGIEALKQPDIAIVPKSTKPPTHTQQLSYESCKICEISTPGSLSSVVASTKQLCRLILGATGAGLQVFLGSEVISRKENGKSAESQSLQGGRVGVGELVEGGGEGRLGRGG